MGKNIRNYKAEAILRDGSSILIRALRSDDTDRLHDLFSRMSRRSVYFRFFHTQEWISLDALAHFTDLDFDRHVALAAVVREEDEEIIAGIGRYSVIDGGRGKPTRAETSFAVADRYQRRGMGTLLLEHLARIARARGIEEFEADVVGENNRMMKVFAGSGFGAKRSIEGGIFSISLATRETEELREAQLRREQEAAAQSIRPIFCPASVAVVGASRQEGSIGAALLSNIVRCGYTGKVYPINPKATEINGLTVYPSLAEVPGPVELAIISVPAPIVEQAIRDCAAAGARAVVVISSGFGEASPEGREAEERIRELVRASGMRMVGPNCMGIVNTDPAYSLNATFIPPWPPAGNIGMMSQSGALGYSILERIQSLNIGLSTFVSVGNKADVSGNDLLAYWSEDERTNVIVLYLESFGNPAKFSRIAPEIARRKPIVAVKSGRSAAGTRAASSHSAALASLDVAVDALFEQAGVIRTDTLEQLFDVSLLLSTQPIPRGPNVGVITNAGGPGILLADACEAKGLKLPEFSESTVEQLRSFLPFQAGVTNPVDMIASATPEHYQRAVEIVGKDPKVDSVIVIYIPPQLHPPEEIPLALGRAAGNVPLEKPVLTVFMSYRGAPAVLSRGPRGRIPSYSFPENAALALSAAEKYGRWRNRPAGSVLQLDPFARAAIRAVIDRVLSRSSGSVWLDPHDLATVLSAAGIDLAASEQARVGEALEAGRRMGYPLVVKVQSDQVLHKTDVGGVLLGIENRDQLKAAIETLTERMAAIGVTLENVLLQREVRGGIEALVGVTADPTFGPLLVCGLGGVLVELLRDVSFRLTPVSDIDAAEMIGKLRASKLLDGYRGAPAGDREGLIRIIRQVSALVDIVPEIRELDLNPVKVLAPGRGAVAVDGRMRIAR